jgi:nucleotide-binding universal stress UspA family protein
MTLAAAVLAATDFSTDARNAALRAGLLAAEWQAPLALLHVVRADALDALRERSPQDPTMVAGLLGQVRQALDDEAAFIATRTGVAPQAHMATGKPLEAIRAAADGARLLALGAQGTSRMRDRLLGTTAERLLGDCPCPVLVVKRGARHRYRRVLVPIDFSTDSLAALDFALKVAPQADLVALHASSADVEGRLWHAGLPRDAVQRHRVEDRRRAVARLEALLQAMGPSADRVSPMVRHGPPARVVLDNAKAISAELVVMGKHGQTPTERWFLGSVTRHVLAGSTCDVAVVSGRH